MFSIKIDKSIIKNVTEIDINLLIPHEKVLVDKKEILSGYAEIFKHSIEF